MAIAPRGAKPRPSQVSPEQTDPEILQEEAAAALLAVSLRTLREWRYRREGPPYCKFNRAVFYRRSSVLNWAASIESKPRKAGAK